MAAMQSTGEVSSLTGMSSREEKEVVCMSTNGGQRKQESLSPVSEESVSIAVFILKK